MFISRQNPNGGKPITRFSLSFDSDSYNWGHKIGHCPSCKEPILLRTRDAADLAKVFAEEINLKYSAIADVLKYKPNSLKNWVIRFLGGRIGD